LEGKRGVPILCAWRAEADRPIWRDRAGAIVRRRRPRGGLAWPRGRRGCGWGMDDQGGGGLLALDGGRGSESGRMAAGERRDARLKLGRAVLICLPFQLALILFTFLSY
jgi:hypothetical protein